MLRWVISNFSEHFGNRSPAVEQSDNRSPAVEQSDNRSHAVEQSDNRSPAVERIYSQPYGILVTCFIYNLIPFPELAVLKTFTKVFAVFLSRKVHHH
jgi:hypothetical protein